MRDKYDIQDESGRKIGSVERQPSGAEQAVGAFLLFVWIFYVIELLLLAIIGIVNLVVKHPQKAFLIFAFTAGPAAMWMGMNSAPSPDPNGQNWRIALTAGGFFWIVLSIILVYIPLWQKVPKVRGLLVSLVLGPVWFFPLYNLIKFDGGLLGSWSATAKDILVYGSLLPVLGIGVWATLTGFDHWVGIIVGLLESIAGGFAGLIIVWLSYAWILFFITGSMYSPVDPWPGPEVVAPSQAQTANIAPCEQVDGRYFRSMDNITMTIAQPGCKINGTLKPSEFDHTIEGDWASAGYYDFTVQRRNKKDGCVTVMFGKMYKLQNGNIRFAINGTDGRCDLRADYSEDFEWARQ